MIYTAFVSVTSHNGVDIDYNPVHYGVVYAYEYTKDVAQQLFYNIHDTVRNNNEHTTNQTYDDVINYGVNDIVRSNNSDMNHNNDDNVKVDVNCYYDDTHNILSFYLPWKQVQVRALMMFIMILLLIITLVIMIMIFM